MTQEEIDTIKEDIRCAIVVSDKQYLTAIKDSYITLLEEVRLNKKEA